LFHRNRFVAQDAYASALKALGHCRGLAGLVVIAEHRKRSAFGPQLTEQLGAWLSLCFDSTFGFAAQPELREGNEVASKDYDVGIEFVDKVHGLGNRFDGENRIVVEVAEMGDG
jgi:hypothetical protein